MNDEKPVDKTDITYMIGQRVIYQNVICVVCSPESKRTDNDVIRDNIVWVDNPEKGYKHWVAKHNIKPLPGGQL